MGIEDLFGGSSKDKNSSNIIIWVLLFIVVFGFGKGKTLCNFTPVENCCEDNKHRRKDCSRNVCCNTSFTSNCASGGILGGLAGPGGFLGGNGAFLLVIIALLFLCKDPKKKDSEECEED